MRSLNSAAAIIGRVEREGLGRNENATRAAVSRHFRAANTEISRREDSGENVTRESGRYFALLDRAARAGLVSGIREVSS